MKMLALAALLGGSFATGALAQQGLDPEYQPLVAPLAAMVAGCLDQAYDEESHLACGPLTHRACHMMGPDGITTYGYVMCATLMGALWNEELGRSWTLVQEGLGPEELEAIRAEQAAWEAYREASCDLAVAEAQGGSMASHVGGDCWVRMTAERTAGFREILSYR